MACLYTTVLDNSSLKAEHSGLMSASVLVPKGQAFKHCRINVLASLEKLQSHSKVLNLWPCGSIKWINCEFIFEKSNDFITSKPEFTLNIESCPLDQISPIPVTENLGPLHIEYSDTGGFTLTTDGKKIEFQCTLEDEYQEPAVFYQPNQVVKNNLTNEGLLFSQVISITSQLALGNGKNINLLIELMVYPLSKFIDALVSIHNHLPAQHNNGQWDLGDVNSIYFNQLKIVIKFNEDINYSIDKGLTSQPLNLKNELYELGQYASGGENWQSPVHHDASCQIPFSVNGFTEKIDSLETQHQGRVSPSVLAFNSSFNCR